jgi:hypothetical protein
MTNTTKHSPGPCHIETELMISKTFITNEQGHRLLQVLRVDSCPELFAAAPELLEACKYAVQVGYGRADVLERLGKAIALAEGRG